MNTDAAARILMVNNTGIAPNFLETKRPSLIVTPMQIIMAGNMTTLPSSVKLGSLVYL